MRHFIQASAGQVNVAVDGGYEGVQRRKGGLPAQEARHHDAQLLAIEILPPKVMQQVRLYCLLLILKEWVPGAWVGEGGGG